MSANDWEAVVGVEVHLQLSTESKMFCGCPVRFGAPANTLVCPVCLALPGALPVPNALAIRYAIRVALALGCSIHRQSRFDRKNYFYPDLPKGYQISQFERPFGYDGGLELPSTSAFAGRRVRIRRVHLEEDTGKLIHDADPRQSVVDLNRAGTPLVEIVTEPDLRDPDEVYDYLRELHLTLSYLGVSDCDLEKGSMRCEPNVSVRRQGTTELGTKTEVKNLNSFRHVRDAMRYEVSRQIEVIESGGTVVQETRSWNPETGRTAAMRAKEEAHDYRYFPEPDIAPITTSDEELDSIRAELGESPAARRARYLDLLDLPPEHADVFLQDPAMADLFDATIAEGADPKVVAPWIVGDLQRERNERADRDDATDVFAIAPPSLARLLALVADGTLSTALAREVLTAVLDTGSAPDRIVEERDLAQISSADALTPAIDAAIEANPRAVEDIRAGNDKAIGALVGHVMRTTKGKANPALVNQSLRERILGS